MVSFHLFSGRYQWHGGIPVPSHGPVLPEFLLGPPARDDMSAVSSSAATATHDSATLIALFFSGAPDHVPIPQPRDTLNVLPKSRSHPAQTSETSVSLAFFRRFKD